MATDYRPTVFIHKTTDGVKDEALNVCIASGEEDIFIDMDTIADRLPHEDTPEVKELRKIVEMAESQSVDYIHLF